MIITIEAATPAETVLGIVDLARARVRQIKNTDPIFKMGNDGARARELSDFADLLMRVEVRAPTASPPTASPAPAPEVAADSTDDHRQDWRSGTRTLTLDRTALEHWRMAMAHYIKTRDRKFRGETQEQATARIDYLRELEREITDALQSYGALPGLNNGGSVKP